MKCDICVWLGIRLGLNGVAGSAMKTRQIISKNLNRNSSSQLRLDLRYSKTV